MRPAKRSEPEGLSTAEVAFLKLQRNPLEYRKWAAQVRAEWARDRPAPLTPKRRRASL